MTTNTKNWKERKCATCSNVFLATDYQVDKLKRQFCSRKCKRYSEASKIKISEALQGRTAWNKGLKTWIISPKRNGRSFNCETCKKEFYRAGWQITKGNIKFCSLNCRRHTEEAKLNMSKARTGIPAWNKGLNKIDDHRLDYERPTKFCGSGKTEESMIIRNSTEMRRWRKQVFERDDYTCQVCGVRGGQLNADHIKRFADFPELRFDLDNGRTLCVECHRKTPTYGRFNNATYGVASLAFA